MLPETKVITYAALRPSMLLDEIEVDEAQLQRCSRTVRTSTRCRNAAWSNGWCLPMTRPLPAPRRSWNRRRHL